MITSENILNLTQALMNFQKEVPKIKKKSNNPFFKSRYAELTDIQDAISEPLLHNGLLVLQFPEDENILTTRLLHASGEWMQSSFIYRPVPELQKEKDKSGNVIWRGAEYITPQAQGSALTYAKRQAITAILNLNIDEDDDGNAASGKVVTQAKPRVVNTNEKPALSKSQWESAIARIAKGEQDLINKLNDNYSLTPQQFQALATLIQPPKSQLKK